MTLTKFKYPVISNAQDVRFNNVAHQVLQDCEDMKRHREYKEQEWAHDNQVYQMLDSAYRRSFDPNIAPELQAKRFTDSLKHLSDIRLPVEFAIIQRKLTYIIQNAPKPKWVAMSRKAKDIEKQSKGKVFQYIFDYVWYLCDGDWEEFKTIISSLIYGIGYMHWYMEYYVSDVEIPDSFDKGTIQYKTIQKTVAQTKAVNMDIRHVLLDHNASDIRDIRKGAIIRHYDKPTFEKLFKNRSIEGIQPISPTECFEKVGEQKAGKNKLVYEVIYYYDESLDRYAETANGYHLNPYRLPRPLPENKDWSPIPSGDKKFPVAIWIDHYLDSELFGMGECRLAKALREIKNKTRNMVFDTIHKTTFQTLIISPDSAFDEDDYVHGQDFVRCEPDEIKPMPVSANMDFTVRMDEQVNSDVAIFTGINITDTANPDKDETATKTAVRRESQFAIIENYIKSNMSYGWKRLWLGMKNCIRMSGRIPMIDENGDTYGFTIRTDGIKLYRSGNEIKDQKKEGSFFFETKDIDYDEDMELVPEMSNVAYTHELEDQKKLEGIALLKGYPEGVVNLNKLAELEAEISGLPRDVINPAPAMTNTDIDLTQDPRDIAKNLDLYAKPPSYDEMASKANAQLLNPEGETPSRRIPESGTLPGVQPTQRGNPAVIS